MEQDRQLQAKDFITPSRPRLTKDRRELSEYEIACLRLDREDGLVPPAGEDDTISVDDFIDSPYEVELDDGSFRVRARLVSVVTPRHAWWEIRVGKRHRFAYPSVKSAARAFTRLSAQDLQPSGWMSSNGGTRESPAIRQPRNLFTELPRILGWQLSPSF